MGSVRLHTCMYNRSTNGYQG